MKEFGPSIPERVSALKIHTNTVIIIKTGKVFKVSVEKGMINGLQQIEMEITLLGKTSDAYTIMCFLPHIQSAV